MKIQYSDQKKIFNVHTEQIPYLSVAMLDALGVPNLYSTRFRSFDNQSGEGETGLRVVVMKHEEEAEAAPVVFKNRDALARQLGSSIEHEPVTDQKHTNHVYVVTEQDLGPILRSEKPLHRRCIDGLVTDLPDVLLTAFGGDCPPIYLADPKRGAIGLVHAGWRSTLGKIPAKAIERMAVSNVCTMCNADIFYSYRAHRMENEQVAMIVNRFGA